ncbi:uncharacterized protein [Lolium perenne]|uniref:uncharacterized protein n=1 Tax=Lolium perenne TaxID=4522 RepID=UPI0021F64D51|nr:uncharacterized protein LOC127316791 [Lolium perenne]
MVVKQIQRELDDMLTRDPVMQRAVLPEDSLFADRYLSSLSAIAEVELSNNFQVTTGDHAGGVAIFMELHYPKIVLETCSLELQLKSLKGEGGFCTTPRWQVDDGPRDGAGPGSMAIEVARGAWQEHAKLFSCSSGRSCLCLSKSTS